MRNAESQQTIQMQHDFKNLYRDPHENFEAVHNYAQMPDMSNQKVQGPSNFEQQNVMLEVSPTQKNEPSPMM